MLRKNIPWRERQQPAKAAAKKRLSTKPSWLPVSVARSGRAELGEAAVRVGSVAARHTVLLSVEGLGAAAAVT